MKNKLFTENRGGKNNAALHTNLGYRKKVNRKIA